MAMNDKLNPRAKAMGLLAVGSSPRWDLEVTESLDRDEWSLEIEGPQTYLAFQLRELTALGAALRLLESEPRAGRTEKRCDAECSLPLGRFGSSAVHLVRDNEDFKRFFIVVGSKGKATLRLSLEGDDVPMFSDALRQVVEDVQQDVSK
jgi:hypothetical protein